jgi:FO synthase
VKTQVCDAADALRRAECGDTVSYTVNRNINYTNVCTLSCAFCAFSKGSAAEALRGPAYTLPLDEITRRTVNFPG